MAYQNMYSGQYNQYNPYPNQSFQNPYYSTYGYYNGNTQQAQQIQQPVQSQPVQSQQLAQQNQGFQWVQGEAAAKAFHVEPGQTVLLMDSDSPVLYFKSSDQSGRPIPMIIYDLVERKPNQSNDNNIDMSAYVKIDELQGLIEETVEEIVSKRISELKEQKNAMQSAVVPTSMIKQNNKKS